MQRKMGTMFMEKKLKIEMLEKNHHRESFDCGIEALNAFLKKHANQNQKNNISRTFVAVDENTSRLNQKKEILGFYTLAAGEIDPKLLPQSAKHPKYPVSIAKLARLAVDLEYQGEGIGGTLLRDACKKIQIASEMVGIFAVVVDAKDATAKSFYQSYGFAEILNSNLKLFMPMAMIEKLTIQ